MLRAHGPLPTTSCTGQFSTERRGFARLDRFMVSGTVGRDPRDRAKTRGAYRPGCRHADRAPGAAGEPSERLTATRRPGGTSDAFIALALRDHNGCGPARRGLRVTHQSGPGHDFVTVRAAGGVFSVPDPGTLGLVDRVAVAPAVARVDHASCPRISPRDRGGGRAGSGTGRRPLRIDLHRSRIGRGAPRLDGQATIRLAGRPR